MNFLFEIIAYGGGSAAVSYLLFQWLGKTWIENKFNERLEALRHQQALEVQRLRVQIDTMLSGNLRLQEREFTVLPDAWEKLDEVHLLVSGLVSPLQQYADVENMSTDRLQEFLSNSDFLKSDINEILNAANKGKQYQETLFWIRLGKAKKAFSEFHGYVARKGIFLPYELEEKFKKISDMLWSAVVSKEVGHQAKDWKMQSAGWDKVKEEVEPLYLEIKTYIHERLQSHSRKE
jgi:hypothetical protein